MFSLIRNGRRRTSATPPVKPIHDWHPVHNSVYVFRVAITNTRIVGLDNQTVTIRYKHRKSNRWRTTRIPGHEFMRRFLQHVLPKGLHKVRYSGLWHPAKREQVAQVRLLLQLDRPAITCLAETSENLADPTADQTQPDSHRICPRCHQGHLLHVRWLSPKHACAP